MAEIQGKKHGFDAETLAFLGGLCLFLSMIEYMIPKPVPFFRLGLANIPILLALPVMDFRSLLVLLLLKVTGQALMNGTLASYVFLFSTAGTLVSGLVMWILHRLAGRHVSFLGISVAGAVASNVVQVFLSLAFIFGASAWLIAPLFMGLGCASGIATGLFALVFSRKSTWYSGFLAKHGLDDGTVPLPVPEGPDTSRDISPANQPGREEKRRKKRFRAPPEWDLLGRSLSPGLIFWWGLGLVLLFLFQSNLAWRSIQVAVLILLSLSAGKRLQPLYFIFMVVTIALFNLLVPSGKVLFEMGMFHVTQGALLDGIYKGLGIVGLVFVSLGTARRELTLPGKAGRLVGRMFWYNEMLLTKRGGLSLGNLVGSMDRVLGELETATHDLGAGQKPGAPPVSRLPAWVGLLFMACVTACFLLPFFF